MKAKALPPLEVLRELLHYEPETGLLTWKKARGRGIKPGTKVGWHCDRGYRHFTHQGKQLLAHRVIWKLQTGRDPDPALVIDHISGDPSDNRWANLREVTQSVNVGRKKYPERGLPTCVFRTNPTCPGEWYAVRVGDWIKNSLTLEEATILAAEWRLTRYGPASVT